VSGQREPVSEYPNDADLTPPADAIRPTRQHDLAVSSQKLPVLRPRDPRPAVDLHENLSQMPSPVRIPMVINPSFPDLRGEHRAEPVSPEPHRFVADLDTALEQPVLDLVQRQTDTGHTSSP